MDDSPWITSLIYPHETGCTCLHGYQLQEQSGETNLDLTKKKENEKKKQKNKTKKQQQKQQQTNKKRKEKIQKENTKQKRQTQKKTHKTHTKPTKTKQSKHIRTETTKSRVFNSNKIALSSMSDAINPLKLTPKESTTENVKNKLRLPLAPHFYIVKTGVYRGIQFSYFCIKTYIVGTRKNRLNEAVLTCTHNLCFQQK